MICENQADITILENDHLTHYWPHIARSLEQCRHVWEDNYTIHGLLNEAIAKRVQVWLVGTEDRWDVFLFSEVRQTQQGRVLYVFLCVGQNFDDYLPIIDASFERFAATVADCDHIKIIGRRGWARKLSKIGFREDSVTLTRRVRGKLNG